MPRFVILRHDVSQDGPRTSHWDLMLEDDGVLLTWALEHQPDTEHRISAEPLPDHRLAYLEHEGAISGNRGQVTRWDDGHFQWVSRREDQIIADLVGQRFTARIRLSRGPTLQRWFFEASSVDSANRG